MHRRDFIKNITTSILSIPLFNLLSCGIREIIHKLPNILIIISDDTGWNDVGFHNPEVITPNLNKLAKEGIELTNFYVHPLCSPTRAALLTGIHPSRFGILGPIAGKDKTALPRNIINLPAFLKNIGYNTAIIGKWHLGLSLSAGPKQYGFDYTYGYLHGQIDPYTHLYKFGYKTWHRNDIFIDEKRHVTDLLTEDAIRYIEESSGKGKPFFLYLAYNLPHYPLNEEKKWLDYYNEETNYSRKQFLAAMTHLDHSIGQVVNCIQKNKLLEDTIIIFLSDNGGQKGWTPSPLEYNGRYKAADRLGDNSPYRGWKGELYEGGIKVPSLLYWKGKFEKGRNDQLIIVEDIFPTVAAILNKNINNEKTIEGIDITPSFKGHELPERTLYWRTKRQIAVRKGRWKLIKNLKPNESTPEYELFNLHDDPYEQNNLFDKEKFIAEDLILEMQQQIIKDPPYLRNL